MKKFEYNVQLFADIHKCVTIKRTGAGKYVKSVKIKEQVPMLEITKHEYITVKDYINDKDIYLSDNPEFVGDYFINPASVNYTEPKKKVKSAK